MGAADIIPLSNREKNRRLPASILQHAASNGQTWYCTPIPLPDDLGNRLHTLAIPTIEEQTPVATTRDSVDVGEGKRKGEEIQQHIHRHPENPH